VQHRICVTIIQVHEIIVFSVTSVYVTVILIHVTTVIV